VGGLQLIIVICHRGIQKGKSPSEVITIATWWMMNSCVDDDFKIRFM